MTDLTEEQNETDSPGSALWPCPDCAGELREKKAGRLDCILRCDRCGWEKMLQRVPLPRRGFVDDRFRPSRREYDA